MKLSQLSSAVVLATLPMTGVFAAALDRSGQSMNAFFQDGNYFEAGISVLDPSVSGVETGTTTREISDMGEDYMFPSAALKLQPHEKFSVGLLYDQPLGADAQYSGNNVFSGIIPENNLVVATMARATGVDATTLGTIVTTLASGGTLNAQQTAINNKIQQETGADIISLYNTVKTGIGKSSVDTSITGTTVEVDTQSLSLVGGYQPTKNWNIYAGPVYQTVKGSVHLRGSAYSIFNGYDLSAPETGGWGWLAGVAYSKPEIALRASLTYRSEIDHDIDAVENFSGWSTTAKTQITTPQSVNLDLQSGIAPNTLAFLHLRWVDWSNFKIQPNQFGQLTKHPLVQQLTGKPEFNLVEYSDDQISATVGVGRKFNDKWTGSVSVGWDSGAGNPVTTLGPTEGYWNVGLGAQYSPAKNYFVAGGVKYFWLGDAQAQTGSQAGTSNYNAEFKDNKALAYGLKIGYRF